MQILATHIVPEGVAGVRLSDYLAGVFDVLPSRKGMKKAIDRGEVRVDGRIASTGHWVESGQRIELLAGNRRPPAIYPLDLEVLLEDDDLAVISKPAGLPVSGNRYKTVQNALSHNLWLSSAVDAYPWPHPVHRLDGPTSGLLLIAKTASAETNLRSQFEQQTIRKRYQAVVMGAAPPYGRIEAPLDGKVAVTEFRRLHQVPSLRSEWLCLLDLFPRTGRTHQLRRHLAMRGHPILGDREYGAEGNILKGKGLFLSAVELSFEHPRTGETTIIKTEAPNKFHTFMAGEERRWRKYQ